MKQIRFHSVTANAVRKGSSIVKNELNKKTVVNFTQEQKPDGTFKRKARFKRVPKSDVDKQRGVLHKAASFKHRCFEGDAPSLTKKLQSAEKQGRFGAKTLRRTYSAAKIVGKGALEIENLGMLSKDVISPRKKIVFTMKNVTDRDGKTHLDIDVDHVKRDDRIERGIVHKVVAKRRGFKSHFKGDTFSMTKFLDSRKPKTVSEAVLVSSAKGAYRYAKFAVHSTENSAKGAENVALYGADKAKAHFKQKLRTETEYSGDTGKAAVKASSVVISGVNGLRRYSNQKKNYKHEKAKLLRYKADQKDNFNRLYSKPVFRSRLVTWVEITKRQDKADLKAAKKKLRFSKKAGTKAEIADKKKAVKEFKREVHQNNLMYKMQKDRVELQKRVVRRERPVTLALQPSVHAVKSTFRSGWQKEVTADSDNDVMRAADKSVSLLKGASSVADQVSHFANRQQTKLYDKSITKQRESAFKKSDPAFKQMQENKKNASWKKNWKKWKDPNGSSKYNSVGDYIKDTIKQHAKNFRSNLKGSVIGIITTLLPILCFLLCFVMVGSVIIGIFQNSAFILGSYNAKDKDLSEAVMSYTKLAYDLNDAVVRCGSKSSWRGGLNSTKKANGFDIITYHDIPETYIYGRDSTYLDYAPANYDFDPYVLWSFLCAYNYDFKVSDEAKKKGEQYEPDYWTFDSKNKAIVKQLFENEYDFKFYYDNQSRWEEKNPYNYWGGGSGSEDGTYYRADPAAYIYDDKPYKYRFKPLKGPTELLKYKDKDGYICITADLRVLDAKNKYAETGMMVMDHRYYSGEKKPFYYHDDENDVYWFHHGGDHDRSSWGWDCTRDDGSKYREEAWFLISPTDTHIWNGSLNDLCMYGCYEKYVWKNDCRFYYVVTQNGTFKENAVKLLESVDTKYKNERLTYFNALIGQDDNCYYGNHQLFHVPVYTTKDIHKIQESGKIYNNYGYDMQKWNVRHCSLSQHKGIDISCGVGTDVHSVIDGEITTVDETNHIVVITTDNKFNFWYDDKKNKVRVTFENVQIKSGLVAGSTVKAGDVIGKVTNNRNCGKTHNDKASTAYLHIKVEGGKNSYFDVIDPMLSFY